MSSSCIRRKWSQRRQRWLGGESQVGWRKTRQGGGAREAMWRRRSSFPSSFHCSSEPWAKGDEELNGGTDCCHVWPGLLITVNETMASSSFTRAGNVRGIVWEDNLAAKEREWLNLFYSRLIKKWQRRLPRLNNLILTARSEAGWGRSGAQTCIENRLGQGFLTSCLNHDLLGQFKKTSEGTFSLRNKHAHRILQIIS